jgi:hypothetical protein
LREAKDFLQLFAMVGINALHHGRVPEVQQISFGKQIEGDAVQSESFAGTMEEHGQSWRTDDRAGGRSARSLMIRDRVCPKFGHDLRCWPNTSGRSLPTSALELLDDEGSGQYSILPAG